MIGRQKTFKNQFCDFHEVDNNVVIFKAVKLVETELNVAASNSFFSSLPLPTGLSVIKCYWSGYKISVE